ncbi:MAG: hypothetical protein BWY17_02467 [Deltaproteobacteria bacterium ADurb.Bin207]|jgi:hypothetical protein|nr:MAG: hypothetical protein BWY17_02467 [Deltaproteobacteria bacterium ADurb.Bin207]
MRRGTFVLLVTMIVLVLQILSSFHIRTGA